MALLSVDTVYFRLWNVNWKVFHACKCATVQRRIASLLAFQNRIHELSTVNQIQCTANLDSFSSLTPSPIFLHLIFYLRVIHKIIQDLSFHCAPLTHSIGHGKILVITLLGWQVIINSLWPQNHRVFKEIGQGWFTIISLSKVFLHGLSFWYGPYLTLPSYRF